MQKLEKDCMPESYNISDGFDYTKFLYEDLM